MALNRRLITVIPLLWLVPACCGRAVLPPVVSDTRSASQPNRTIKTLPMRGHFKLQCLPSSIRRIRSPGRLLRASAVFPVVDKQLSPIPFWHAFFAVLLPSAQDEHSPLSCALHRVLHQTHNNSL